MTFSKATRKQVSYTSLLYLMSCGCRRQTLLA